MIYMASTTIDKHKTAQEIMQALAKAGAIQILTLYNNSDIVGLSFIVSVNNKNLPFKLPIRWEGVLKSMEKDKHTPRHFCNPEQASRVAWRQIKRWIDAQLALLEVDMVKIEEIFMPYLLLDKQQTLYEKLIETKFKLLE